MSTSRLLIIVLIALNAIAFAATQGWLGAAPPLTEPERLGKQLDPERIRLASDPPAADAAAPPAGTDEDGASRQTESPSAAPDEADAASAVVPPLPEAVLDTAAAVPATEAASPVPQAADDAPSTPVALSCFAWSGLSVIEADTLARRLRASGVDAERSKTESPSSWWVRIPPQSSREQAETRVAELHALGVRDLFIVQDTGPAQHAISLGVFKTEARARVLLNQLRAKGVRNAGVEARMSTAYRIQAELAADAVREIERGMRGIASRRTACSPR